MHKSLMYAAYGWLAFSGTAHFVDVVSQYLRALTSQNMLRANELIHSFKQVAVVNAR